jgi:hypothetical protein
VCLAEARRGAADVHGALRRGADQTEERERGEEGSERQDQREWERGAAAELTHLAGPPLGDDKQGRGGRGGREMARFLERGDKAERWARCCFV